jgi:hypothetical protein
MGRDAVATFKTGTSVVVDRCQICDHDKLEPVLFLGYLPPVNKMRAVGSKLCEETAYPAQMLYCPRCHLAQLGLIVDSAILFPPEYPYTSSTTRILRENFAELYSECLPITGLSKDDLVVDIGSNDGNLLSNFKDHHRVLGVTPEDIGRIAIERGIPTVLDYFTKDVVRGIVSEHGKAKVITATNVFAHIENVNDIVDSVLELLQDDGVFISESHYLLPLIETLQYDTIYHEHLRYYSLHSLRYLLDRHGLEIIHAKRIPTHGGSVRVYASRAGKHSARDTVAKLLKEEEPIVIGKERLLEFAKKVAESKIGLYDIFNKVKSKGARIYGISAPSRASTLINYVGIDDGIMDCVLEIKGSHKIGKYMPGTIIPVIEEAKLYRDNPEYALILSWHIAGELAPKLKANGFEGDFIIPLPKPRILRNSQV